VKVDDMSAKQQQGFFALENAQGRVVRSFNWESSKITVIFRHDKRRIETVSSLKELEDAEIPFSILAESTPSEIRRGPLKIAGGASIRWVDQDSEFSPSYELSGEDNLSRQLASAKGGNGHVDSARAGSADAERGCAKNTDTRSETVGCGSA